MITSYLEKLQKEYLEEKFSVEKKLNNLQIRLKENKEFIKMLEEGCDPSYESFSPRDLNSKNKAKVRELQEEQEHIQKNIENEKLKEYEWEEKLTELSEVIKVCRKTLRKNTETIDDEVYRLTLLETQENERQRISRELHDSTVQNLTSLVHKSELCSKLVDLDSVRCKLELNTMSKMLREIINDTRQIIYNLRPMSFDDIGLDVTIERALDKLENAKVKKIDFSVVGKPRRIKSVIGITLLRIVQEACSNAIRHADASYIKVVLTYEDEKVSILIEDDGRGFDVNQSGMTSRNDNSGFGLSMMKERVYLLSGNINIESKCNSGTKVIVEVPILNEEEK